jgi:hypothetical protein
MVNNGQTHFALADLPCLPVLPTAAPQSARPHPLAPPCLQGEMPLWTHPAHRQPDFDYSQRIHRPRRQAMPSLHLRQQEELDQEAEEAAAAEAAAAGAGAGSGAAGEGPAGQAVGKLKIKLGGKLSDALHAAQASHAGARCPSLGHFVCLFRQRRDCVPM